MDFFGHQEAARRATRLLFGLYAASVALLVAGTYLVCAWGAHRWFGGPGLWDPVLLAEVAAVVVAIVVGGSAFKVWQLREGGAVVAESLGGRRIPARVHDRAERQLRNVVEEMAIAAGLPVPDIFILDGQLGLNAFAAGNSPDDAAIGLTEGCLRELDREELQGVVAHELSHILHGDMRLNLRMMGVLHGLLCLTIAGNYLAQSSGSGHHGLRAGSRQNNGGKALGFGLVLLAAGYLGMAITRVIKAAVSRQREFLADAAAVQFTRYPDGIRNALLRIGGLLPTRSGSDPRGSHVHHARTEEVSHMLFSAGVRSGLRGLLATHPPLMQRLLRIDPRCAEIGPALARKPAPILEGAEDPTSSMAPRGPTPSTRPMPLSPEDSVARIGDPGPAQLAAGVATWQALPALLRSAVHEGFSARAVVFAVLLDPDSAARRREQLDALREQVDSGTLRELQHCMDAVRETEPMGRIALVEASLPALRALSPRQRTEFLQGCETLAQGRPGDLRCFCLHKLVRVHLDPPSRRTRHQQLHWVMGPALRVLGALCHAGHPGGQEARTAWADGLRLLNLSTRENPLPARERPALEALDRSLDELAQVSGYGKRSFLLACARMVASDGVVAAAEYELLRAVADTLGCPMPPHRTPTAGAEACAAPASPPALRS